MDKFGSISLVLDIGGKYIIGKNEPGLEELKMNYEQNTRKQWCIFEDVNNFGFSCLYILPIVFNTNCLNSNKGVRNGSVVFPDSHLEQSIFIIFEFEVTGLLFITLILLAHNFTVQLIVTFP